jgi:hypothetical protein
VGSAFKQHNIFWEGLEAESAAVRKRNQPAYGFMQNTSNAISLYHGGLAARTCIIGVESSAAPKWNRK